MPGYPKEVKRHLCDLEAERKGTMHRLHDAAVFD